MLGNATKYFAGLAALAFVALVGYGLAEAMWAWAFDATYADYRLLGISIFTGLFTACALLTGVGLAAGDRPSEDRVRQHDHPAQIAWWPVLAAVGVAILIIGLVADTIVTLLGLLVLAFAAVEWVLLAWSEHLSTDAERNEAVRRRLERPFAIPLLGGAVVAGGVLLISRVLLAVSRNAASWIALGMMIVVVAGAFVIYLLPGMRSRLVVAMVAVGVLAVIAGGIAGIAAGTRQFEPHHAEDESSEDEPASEGAEEGAMVESSAPVHVP